MTKFIDKTELSTMNPKGGRPRTKPTHKTYKVRLSIEMHIKAYSKDHATMTLLGNIKREPNTILNNITVDKVNK